MTNHSLEVPALEDLDHLPVEVVPGDDLGVVSVRAEAGDGDVVTLTWDDLARSFTVVWLVAGAERLRIERELAVRITVTAERGAVVFGCWSRGSDLSGTLVVQVAQTVSVSDAMLRG